MSDKMNLNNTSNNSVSMAESNRQTEDKYFNARIPTVVMLAIFAVVGLVGNILVLVVYYKKMRLNPTKVIIMTIASFDLVANVVAIPIEIRNTMGNWTLSQLEVCKFSVFISSFTTLGGAMSLCVVAVARYRKVCKPYNWQVTIRIAICACFIAAIIAALCSIPITIIFSIYKTPLNIKVHACFIDIDYIKTDWPLLTTILYIVIYIVIVVTFVVLYVHIAVTAWRHREHHGGTVTTSRVKTKPNTKCKSTLSEEETAKKDALPHKQHEGFVQDFDLMSQLGGKHKLRFPTCCCRRWRSVSSERNSRCPVIMEVYSPALSSDYRDSSSEVPRSEQISSETTSSEVTSSKTKFAITNPETQSEETTHSKASISEDKIVDSPTKLHQPLHLHNPMWKSQHNPPESTNLTFDHENKQDLTEIEKSIDERITQLHSKKMDANNEFYIEHDPNKDNRRNLETDMPTNKKESKLQENESKKQLQTGTRKVRPRRLGKRTIMLIAVSLIFLLSYLPFLILSMIMNKRPKFYPSLDGVGLAFFSLFYRLYFLNSAANCIVYSWLDVNFRLKCNQLLRCRRRRFC